MSNCCWPTDCGESHHEVSRGPLAVEKLDSVPSPLQVDCELRAHGTALLGLPLATSTGDGLAFRSDELELERDNNWSEVPDEGSCEGHGACAIR